MRDKLTKSLCDDIEYPLPSVGRLTIWDTKLPGFGLMVTPIGARGGGVKSYIVQYRLGGRGAPTRRVTIGHHGREWQPAAARDEAAKLLRQVKEGIDPYEERNRRREAERRAQLERWEEQSRAEALLYPVFCETFIESYAKRKQVRSWQATERALKDAGRHLDRSRVDRITREGIAGTLDDIKQRSASAAIAAHKALRKLFKWAVSEGKLDKSPMAEMEAPAKNTVRTRVLRAHELRDIWHASMALGYPFGSSVQLLIATGQRLREGAEARWGEFHLDEKVWIVPADAVKADEEHERDHLVPLNARAMTILKGLPRIAPPDDVELPDDERPLFTTRGATPISGFSKAKLRLDARIVADRVKASAEAGEHLDESKAAIEDWTNHDIRRTLSTVLQALGVASNIIDLIQAHVAPGMSKVSRHYQHYDFYEEKRAAMDLWNRYLDGVIDGDESAMELVRKAEKRLAVTPSKSRGRKGLAPKPQQQ